jgi:hypothetical protein
VLVVHATKKLRDRVKAVLAQTSETSTTRLGDWYATAIFWRPQVCLFVNELTLLPVLLPLAPAATLAERFPAALVDVLAAHNADAAFIAAELAEMGELRLAKTSNRSVVGMMNEFTFLAETHLGTGTQPDLPGLSVRLAGTPCGPLYKRHVYPNRELAALLAQ